MLKWWGLLFLAVPCSADPNLIGHSGVWFNYFGDHAWNQHWGLHLEGQLRRVEGLSKGQQLLLRSGVNFEANPHLKFMLGYTNQQNYSYDRFSFPSRINEHRIHEEATVSHPLSKFRIQQRFRLEQRFLDYAGDWQFRQRFRYRFQANLPVSKRNYLVASNEILATFGSHSVRAFDQNRTYGAIGRNFGKFSRLEAGYMYQYQQVTDARFRRNHLMQITFFSKQPFRKQR